MFPDRLAARSAQPPLLVPRHLRPGRRVRDDDDDDDDNDDDDDDDDNDDDDAGTSC